MVIVDFFCLNDVPLVIFSLSGPFLLSSFGNEGKGIEITVRSFGIEANPQTTIVARTSQELTTKLETEFKAYMEYAKILLTEVYEYA